MLRWHLFALLVLMTQHVSQVKLLLELGLLGVTGLDHRITKCMDWLKIIQFQPHYDREGHLPPDQVAQIPIQPGPGHF